MGHPNSTITFGIPVRYSNGKYRSGYPFGIDMPVNASGPGVTVTSTAPTGSAGSAAAMTELQASRLLAQGTFGATSALIDTTTGQAYDGWFADQANATPSLTFTAVNAGADFYPTWIYNVVNNTDQLRQRMAFAFSQLFVVSKNSMALVDEERAIAKHYDTAVKGVKGTGALGNFRDLMEDMTLSPAMGLWLSMYGNDKANPTLSTHADENFAREDMQLFGMGLIKLNDDGTIAGGGAGTPTYDQTVVEQMAKVMTGWRSQPVTYPAGSENSWTYDNDYLNPMYPYEAHHDTTAKTIFDGIVIPAGQTAYQDLTMAMDAIFNHSSTPPFICKQLIQRLVCSNPSPAYVSRVVAKFKNNGNSVRGDLLAVARAILTDSEAVNPHATGKLREPLLRMTNLWRACAAISDANNYLDPFVLVNNTLTAFGQQTMYAPSVFNFYVPDYRRAGPITDAGLVAPEFQITNENLLVTQNNLLKTWAYQFKDSTGTNHGANLGSGSILNHTASWEPLANTPNALVDELNLVFMQGQMSSTMRTTLVNYCTSITSAEPWSRVMETIDLLINSSQYAVQT